jgi:hypothetical protein
MKVQWQVSGATVQLDRRKSVEFTPLDRLNSAAGNLTEIGS